MRGHASILVIRLFSRREDPAATKLIVDDEQERIDHNLDERLERAGTNSRAQSAVKLTEALKYALRGEQECTHSKNSVAQSRAARMPRKDEVAVEEIIHRSRECARERRRGEYLPARAAVEEEGAEQIEGCKVHRRSRQRSERVLDDRPEQGAVDARRIPPRVKVRAGIVVFIDRLDGALHKVDAVLGDISEHAHLVLIALALYIEHLREQFCGKGAQTRLRVGQSDAAGEAEADRGDAVSGAALKGHVVLAKIARAEYERAGGQTFFEAAGDIFHIGLGVLAVAVGSDDDGRLVERFPELGKRRFSAAPLPRLTAWRNTVAPGRASTVSKMAA